MTAPISTPTSTQISAPIVFTAPRIEAALIDLDGTMVDTADDFAAGLNGMLAQIDAEETTREEVMGFVGKGSEHLIRSVLAQRLPADDAQSRFEEALALYQDEYAKINGQHTRLYPDVVAGLAALRDAGVRLVCVTNKPHRFAVELLEQYGLSQYFEAVLGGDSTPKKKPDPLPMLTACAQLGVAPQAAVAIGDSENDAIAGRAAGMATLTVPYGYNHGQPVQKIKSDGIVATLLDAAKAVAAHNLLT